MKGEELTKCTGGVPTKDPLKVKSLIERSPITLKVCELANSRTLEKSRLGAYIVV